MFYKTNYRLMQVKSIAECSKEHSAILSTIIKLPFVIKIIVLSIFDWSFYTGFTVIGAIKLRWPSIFLNCADPDGMLHFAAPHLNLHCLLNYPFAGRYPIKKG